MTHALCNRALMTSGLTSLGTGHNLLVQIGGGQQYLCSTKVDGAKRNKGHFRDCAIITIRGAKKNRGGIKWQM